jgi:hypothetical protein
MLRVQWVGRAEDAALMKMQIYDACLHDPSLQEKPMCVAAGSLQDAAAFDLGNSSKWMEC